jgi:hypothetical protein
MRNEPVPETDFDYALAMEEPNKEDLGEEAREEEDLGDLFLDEGADDEEEIAE